MLLRPRCDYSVDRCRASFPPTEEITRGAHAVRCFRTHELPPFEQRSRLIVGAHAGAAGREDRSLLTVRGLSASYGDTQVLRDLDWSVTQGECLAIVGESGSGKTTLARCVVGLHHRWTGEVALAGTPLAHEARARPAEVLRSIQYVFQNPYGSLNPRKRVSQILELPLTQFFDYSSRERRRRIVEALEAAALPADFRNRTPGELSGGERQRVAIARALVVEPRIIVCDEITSALDVSVQAAIVEVLRGLQAERGLALVFITHNLALVRSIAQRAAVMQHGRIVEQGDTDQVLDKPQAEYTQRLLADIPRPYDAQLAASVGGRSDTTPDGW